MSGQNVESSKKGFLEEGFGSALIKIAGLLGGGAAIFYILGFTIVQTFTYKNELEGMFWFTKEFYTDAGAKFLLEMVRAPLLAPYIFLPYLCLLLMLVPKKSNLEFDRSSDGNASASDEQALNVNQSSKGTLARKQWIKISALLFFVVLAYCFTLYFDKLMEQIRFNTIISNIFPNPTDNPSPNVKHSLAFFSFVMPLVISLGIFLCFFYGRLAPNSKSRNIYYVVLVTYILFISIIPITFGFHLYDWKIVPVKDTHMIRKLLPEYEQHNMASRMWLLGKFGDKYLFFKKEGIEARGILEAFDDDHVTYLNFDPKRADSLRAQMAEGFDRAIIDKSQVFINESLSIP